MTQLVATKLAVAPDGNPWIVSDIAWELYSQDSAMFQMVQLNSAGDTAWSLLPGGGLQISISPVGNPWITNYEHVAFKLGYFAP